MLTPSNRPADFCLKIDFVRHSPDPSRIFRAMSGMIEAFERFDSDLVGSIDAKIEPVMMLEDVEVGSLKAWLSYALRSVDDDALKELDWKKAVGAYLVKAKYITLEFLDGRSTITDLREIESLERRLLEAATETDVRRFPAYAPIPRTRLLKGIDGIEHALDQLPEGDKATYITNEGSVGFNAEFEVEAETMEALITRETISSRATMILKVKRPDYLGEAKWEFRHGKSPFDAKVLDADWLRRFHQREEDVRPGDSLRCEVVSAVDYGFDNEVVSTSHCIVRVIAVVQATPSDQSDLFPPLPPPPGLE